MSRRRRFQHNIKSNSTFSLNITSLTDMFTILLVFLLQSYATSDVQINLEKDISLPLSNVEVNPVKSIQISVSQSELKLDGRTIASLSQGKFASQDTDSSDSNFIKPLFAELEKISKTENPSEDIRDGKILMMADSNLSYDTIRKVMYTASHAGFPKLKMATVVGK